MAEGLLGGQKVPQIVGHVPSPALRVALRGAASTGLRPGRCPVQFLRDADRRTGEARRASKLVTCSISSACVSARNGSRVRPAVRRRPRPD